MFISFSNTFKKFNVAPILIFLFSAFIYIYKIDYPYFFTDEILYTGAGEEYVVEGDYTQNLQHPFVAKYIVGIVTAVESHNVALLRLPFAICGIISAMLVYVISQRFVNKKWAVLGSMIYLVLPFTYTTNRMVLLEAPMHMFWLLFTYYFLKFVESKMERQLVVAAIFFGLAMATKITTLVLIPAVLVGLITSNLEKRKLVKTIIIFAIISSITVLTTYGDLIAKRGVEGLLSVVSVFYDTIVHRNEQGKNHVIGETVYKKSPAWFYLYYIYNGYVMPLGILVIAGIYGFAKKKSINKIKLYFLTLSISSIAFLQLLPLKNERYIASIELPLVFILIIGLSELYERSRQHIKEAITFTILAAVMINVCIFVLQKPTQYNALFQYYREYTNNYRSKDRMIIFGSTRSSKWYRRTLPNQNLLEFGRDYKKICPDFVNFQLFAFDPDELIENPNNALAKFVYSNKQFLIYQNIGGMPVYTKIKREKPLEFECDNLWR